MIDINAARKLSRKALEALLIEYRSKPGVLSHGDLVTIENLQAALYAKRQKKKAEQGGYVYIIQSPIGYKIGFVERQSPQKRLSQIKTANPDAKLIHTIPCGTPKASEGLLHEKLGHLRKKREFFHLPDEIVNELLEIENELELLEYCGVL